MNNGRTDDRMDDDLFHKSFLLLSMMMMMMMDSLSRHTVGSRNAKRAPNNKILLSIEAIITHIFDVTTEQSVRNPKYSLLIG